jgi:hypothetical protein
VKVELTFTVPIPCGYSTGVQTDVIDKDSCPMIIEMQVPKGAGSCESTLTAEARCGVQIEDPTKWNEPHILNILHKDTGNYELTPSESERKVYLKTYNFPFGKVWTGVQLPVINVIRKLSSRFLFLKIKSAAFIQS